MGELFPAGLRERFARFFEQALRRDYAERFDNPAEMLKACADQLQVTRQRIGQALTKARQRWGRYLPVTVLREDVLRLLRGLGGIATHQELIRAVLA